MVLLGSVGSFPFLGSPARPKKGLPQYNDDDVFVLSGAEDLVVCDQQPPSGYAPTGYTITRFRPRTEGLFARIERWVRDSDGDTHWRATTRDNVTSLYGKSATARVADPENSRRVYQWLLEESFDSKGNHILYEYVSERQIGRVTPSLSKTAITLRPTSGASFTATRPTTACLKTGAWVRSETAPTTVTTVIQIVTDPPLPFRGTFRLRGPARRPSDTLGPPSAETTIPDTWPVSEDRFSTSARDSKSAPCGAAGVC